MGAPRTRTDAPEKPSTPVFGSGRAWSCVSPNTKAAWHLCNTACPGKAGRKAIIGNKNFFRPKTIGLRNEQCQHTNGNPTPTR